MAEELSSRAALADVQAADTKIMESHGTLDSTETSGDSAALATKKDEPAKEEEEEESHSIPNDVYTLFFVSELCGPASFYSIYVFLLKISLYSFLAIDTFRSQEFLTTTDNLVLSAQFLMIPVAVAMQTDLIDSYQLGANVTYDHSIRKENPGATIWKYKVSTLARFLDGAYSLMVNFVVMLTAQDVLGLFLNFAALHFLQDIDNVALDLAAKGYLTEDLERKAAKAEAASLPMRRSNDFRRSLDSVFFISTLLVLIAVWTTLFIIMRKEE